MSPTPTFLLLLFFILFLSCCATHFQWWYCAFCIGWFTEVMCHNRLHCRRTALGSDLYMWPWLYGWKQVYLKEKGLQASVWNFSCFCVLQLFDTLQTWLPPCDLRAALVCLQTILRGSLMAGRHGSVAALWKTQFAEPFGTVLFVRCA